MPAKRTASALARIDNNAPVDDARQDEDSLTPSSPNKRGRADRTPNARVPELEHRAERAANPSDTDVALVLRGTLVNDISSCDYPVTRPTALASRAGLGNSSEQHSVAELVHVSIRDTCAEEPDIPSETSRERAQCTHSYAQSTVPSASLAPS